MEIYTTNDLCKLLKVNRSKIQWLRDNQLLKARKLGKGFITTEDELKEFMALTAGLDLSSKKKIEIVGMNIKRIGILHSNNRISDSSKRKI